MRRVLFASLLSAACGGSSSPPGFPIEPTDTFVRDLARSEDAAFDVQRDIARTLLDGLARGDRELSLRALGAGFRGRCPSPEDGESVPDSALTLARLEPGGPYLEASPFLDRLASQTERWARIDRLECEASGFWLAPEGAAAVARLELRLAGELLDGAGREDLRLLCDARLERAADGWVLTHFDTRSGTRAASRERRFVDVTHAVGLEFNDSAENRAMLQSFVDEHQTFARGGLTVVDWNRDGFQDLLASRRDQMARLFLNDGAGGFVPEPLPFEHSRECGSLVCVVDLDDDGLEEIVSTTVGGYEGDRAWCDIYTREDGAWVRRSRALEFPNPVGVRRLAIQTVVPADFDGDGRLDLFFAVYGTAHSRGERYNTVEAHDGADNHLFLNQGDLLFREESEARGITGTQYTYVAQAFDFDDDGDTDLFEGNDFGPNILWRNDGAGNFHADRELGFGGVCAYTMGVSIADFDNSGRWSLYLSNMSSRVGARLAPLAPDLSDTARGQMATIASGNMLYTEPAEGSRWVERAASLGVDEAEWAWACIFWDPDNDGDKDLFVTNGFASHSDANAPDWETFYWRQVAADAGFLERGERSQNVNTDVSVDSSFDGYQRDRLFYWPDDSRAGFAETGYLFGLDAEHDGRCAVPIDVDGDGDLDLALWTLTGLVLYENRGPRAHFARVRLTGVNGTLPLGAEVRLEAAGVTQRDRVEIVDGFQSQVATDVHFGLGAATRIEGLEVRWPSGVTERFADLPVDRRLSITEGAGEVIDEALPAWPDRARPRPTNLFLESFLERPNGGTETLGSLGTPALVRVQVTDEVWPGFAALRERAPKLQLKLVLGPQATAPPPIEGVDVYQADGRFLEALFGTEREPVYPTTVVFDVEGHPRRTFLGEVDPEPVARVAATLTDQPAFPDLLVMTGRRELAQGRPRVAESLFLRALELDERRTYAAEGLARAYVAFGKLDRAEAAYERAVQIDPDYALGHFNLAVARIALERPKEAIEPLRQALRVAGEVPQYLMLLGEAASSGRRYQIALDAFERATIAAPDDPLAFVNHAKVLGGLRRFAESKASYEAALAIDPGNEEAARGLQLVERLLRDE